MASRPRYRSNVRIHTVPVRALSPWLVVAIIFFAGCMSWVYARNQIYARGNEIKSLEDRVSALETRNAEMVVRVNQLKARPALNRKVRDGVVKMIPITPERVIQIRHPNADSAEGLRVAANRRMNR